MNREEKGNIAEDNSEDMTHVNRRVRHILRQRHQQSQQSFKNNDYLRNDD